MKKKLSFFLGFLFFFSISFSQELLNSNNNTNITNPNIKYLLNAPSNTIVDAVLFSINSTPYTLLDLKKYMFLSGIRDPKFACFNYIYALLIEKKVKDLGGKLPKEAVEKAINDILQRNGMDLSTLKLLLREKNISFEEFKDFIKLELLVNGYLQDFGRPDIKALAQDYNLEIYEPLCYVDELKDFYVPNYLKKLKIINPTNATTNTANTANTANTTSNNTSNAEKSFSDGNFTNSQNLQDENKQIQNENK